MASIESVILNAGRSMLCGDTFSAVSSFLDMDEENAEIICEGGSFPCNTQSVLEKIKNILNTRGYCGLILANGSGCLDYHPMTFSHCFILFRYRNHVYRIESYAAIYLPRCILFDDYEVKLSSLLN